MGRNDNLDYRGKKRFQTDNFGESQTIQSDNHNADINKIMERFKQTGIIDSLDAGELMFKDVSEFTDLADALNQAKIAEVEFMKLPSKVREIFDHDVAVWLDSAHDEEKRDALVAAGFIEDPGRDTSGSSGGTPNGVIKEIGSGESGGDTTPPANEATDE